MSAASRQVQKSTFYPSGRLKTLYVYHDGELRCVLEQHADGSAKQYTVYAGGNVRCVHVYGNGVTAPDC